LNELDIMTFSSKQQLRSLIRTLIYESYDNFKINHDEITYDCIMAVAEYVGANERFDYQKYANELDRFCHQWKQLYRIWPNQGHQSLEKLEMSVKSKDYFSASKTLSAFETGFEDISLNDNHMIVTFSGWGFDPIEYLQKGLQLLQLSKEDRNFIYDVIYTNKRQEEVIVLNASKFKRV
jgi:hypothetical protein